MLTLVFDTCFNKTYIVLKKDGKILNSLVINSTDENYHSVYLIPKIRDLLKEHNIQIKNLDAIGVNIGPGSFTGIRAGITIARVLCQQANIKLIGVPSLQILAKCVNEECTVVLDARKNKVYFAQYHNGNIITEPSLLEKTELIDKLSSKKSSIVSDTSIGRFLSENNIEYTNYEENDENLGIYLSEIVDNILSSTQDNFNWAKVKPLYIQPPSITKPKELKNV